MAHLKKAVIIFAEVNSSRGEKLADTSSEPATRSHPEIWKLTEW